MKKCPYCAEEIQDEAILCRFCGRDIDGQSLKPTQLPSTSVYEPPIWTSIMYMCIIVPLVEVGSIIIAMIVFSNLSVEWVQALLINLMVRVPIGYLGAKGAKPVDTKTSTFIWYILLAFIPIVSWVPSYYAGKAIARKIPKNVTTAMGIILVILLIVAGIGFVAYMNAGYSTSNSYSQNENPVTYIKPSSTPKPTATSRGIILPSFTPRPTLNAMEAHHKESCIPWTEITDSHVGETLCVTGMIVKIHSAEPYRQIIRFSEDPGTFLIRGRNYAFDDIKVGNCIQVRGPVEDSGTYHFMEMKKDSVSLRIVTKSVCE